jgi:hypothetical protein
LIEGKAVSDLCDKHHIHHGVLPVAEDKFSRNGTATFESKQSRSQTVLAVGFTNMRKAESIPLVHCHAGKASMSWAFGQWLPVRHRHPLFVRLGLSQYSVCFLDLSISVTSRTQSAIEANSHPT